MDRKTHCLGIAADLQLNPGFRGGFAFDRCAAGLTLAATRVWAFIWVMHRALLLVGLLTFFVSACSNVPKPASQQLKATSKSYDTVERGWTMPQIEAFFGPALRQESDASYYWETRYDQKNYVALKVWFDEHGRATKVQRTRGRAVNAPGVHTEAVTRVEK